MNKLSTILKRSAFALFTVAMPLMASAEPVRVPDVAPVHQHQSINPKALAAFRSFYKNRGANSETTISAAPTSFMTKGVVRQRPANILRSPEAPTGNFLALIPRHSNGASNSDAYLGKLNATTGTVTKLFSGDVFSNGEDYYFETASVRGNIMYIPSYIEDMVTHEITVLWKTVDVETGERLNDIVFGTDTEALNAFLYGMTYDSDKDLFYGLCFNMQTARGGALVCIDPKQPVWKAEIIGDLGGVENDFMANIVYNPGDNMLYGLKDTGTLYMVDVLGNGFADLIELRQYDDFMEDFMFPEYSTANAMCYSPYDHAFIFIYRDNFMEQMRVIGIDDESYEPYTISEISPLGWVAALVCTDPYAQDDAPDRIANPIFNFEGASLSGTYTVTMPTTTFNGLAIDASTPITVNVTIDGEVYEPFTGKAGEVITKNLTLEQGQHEFKITANIGSAFSPITVVRFYVGNDSPVAPANVQLSGNIISWDAPGAIGQHNGYVDTTDLTYDVYFSGVKQNLNPIRNTKFRFAQPSEMERRLITVTATAHEMTSLPSSPLSRPVGRAFELPFSIQPANETEASLFETFNANGDDNEFKYYTANEDYNCFTIRTGYYYQMPDDWLFLPAVALEDEHALYKLSMMYRNSYGADKHLDNMEIYIGDAPAPDKMTRKIYKHSARNTPNQVELNINFAIEEPGDYIIGIHSMPGDETQYRGVELHDFSISQVAGANANAPGEASIISITPDAGGDLTLAVEVKAPVNTISGRALPSSTDVTIKVATSVDVQSDVVKPGESVTINVATATDGFSDIFITPSTVNGEGLTSYAKAYSGEDTPLPPTITYSRIHDDNLGVTFSWEAPTGGAHGGYVDFDNLKYDIYLQGTAGTSTRVEEAEGMTYEYRIDPGKQSSYHVGPVAVNRMGMSTGGEFVYEALGTPYVLPFVEEWGNSAFNYTRWYFNATDVYAGSQVESISSTTGLGIGDPVFGVGGGINILNSTGGHNTRYEFVAPKPSTEGYDNLLLSVRYWDYAQCGSIELWGRTARNQEYRKIAELTPNRLNQEWVDWEVALPDEFSNQPWIQINLRGTLENDQMVVLDNYKIYQNIEHDFAVTSVSGVANTMVGSTESFSTVIANTGSEPGTTTLKVELLGDGNVLDSDITSVGRTISNGTFERNSSFYMSVDYLNYNKLTVRATVESPDDSNSNNDVMETEFVLADHAMPIVTTLKATRDGADVILDWETPETSYGSPEGFEVLKSNSMAETMGLWTNIDLDGMTPFAIEGFRFDGDTDKCAWSVWNHVDMKSGNEDRLRAHTGKQALLARSIQYVDGTQPYRSSDWLISPEVEGGSKVSFWFNTLSSTYTETIEIWYSSTTVSLDPSNIISDDQGRPIECGAFKKFTVFSKSGSELWEQCDFTLPNDAKYFAFVYGSIGMFGAMIDDVVFTPVKTYNYNIDSYRVIRKRDNENAKLIESGVTGNTYRDSSDAIDNYYWLQTVVEQDGEYFTSPNSNVVNAKGTSVDELVTEITVAGGKGRVMLGNLTGKTAEFFDAEGRKFASVLVNSDRQTVPAPAGVVIVVVDGVTFKTFVR